MSKGSEVVAQKGNESIIVKQSSAALIRAACDGRLDKQSSKELLSLAADGTLDLMAFTVPPKDPRARMVLGECVTIELSRMVEGRPSKSEAAFLSSQPCGAEDMSPTELALFDKFDEVIIEQAAILGWRIQESPTVRDRIAIWSDHVSGGIEKLKRFNESINRYAEVKRGTCRLPLTEPEWYQSRKNALQEIKALQKGLKAKFMQGDGPTSLAEMYAALREEIAKKPHAYRCLTQNLTSFLNYLEMEDSSPKNSSPLTEQIMRDAVTPAVVVDGWLDYALCTADGKSRQIISRLGRRKRQ